MLVVVWAFVFGWSGFLSWGLALVGVPWWAATMFGLWCCLLASLFTLGWNDAPGPPPKPEPHTHWWL